MDPNQGKTSPGKPRLSQGESPGSRSPGSQGPSPGSSRGSPGPSPLISDAGSFDPDRVEARAQAQAEAPPEPGQLHALPEPLPEWEEETVRSILNAQGGALHALAGVSEDDWVYTQTELAAIAPPLTRILNRYDATRAAAGTGDELALLIGMSGYVGRSIAERRRVLAALADQEPEPVTGVRAEPGTGPPDEDLEPEDIEWRRSP